MPIKNIQVYLDNDAACETRIEIAAHLANQYEAHLCGLYSMRKAIIPTGVMASVDVAVYEAIDEASKKQCELARNVFFGNSTVTNIDGEFRFLDGFLTDDLAIRSQYADLLVIPQNQDDEANMNLYYRPRDILLSVACPVLLLPHGLSVALPAQTALVAWDGGRECANALRAAWPMLGRVKKIDVVSVSSNDAEAMDITLHINRHGIEAETHLIDGGERNAGNIILEQAESLGTDLLVMGAYGHSRLREMVLGGSTKYVSEHAQLPVLFSH